MRNINLEDGAYASRPVELILRIYSIINIELFKCKGQVLGQKGGSRLEWKHVLGESLSFEFVGKTPRNLQFPPLMAAEPPGEVMELSLGTWACGHLGGRGGDPASPSSNFWGAEARIW